MNKESKTVHNNDLFYVSSISQKNSFFSTDVIIGQQLSLCMHISNRLVLVVLLLCVFFAFMFSLFLLLLCVYLCAFVAS